MVGLWRAGTVFLIAATLFGASCHDSQPAVETAVTPSPSLSTPDAIYLPLTQAQPVATGTLPPASTATPEPVCATPGTIVPGSLTSQWAGTLNYRVYFPPCYGENGRTYPTLYLLPGNIHTDSIWQELGLQQAADSLMLGDSPHSFLIIMADGGWIAQNTSGGPGSYESVILQELIPHIEAQTCAWAAPQGRAIGGLSRGGYWALEIAFRHPATFAGVGGHSAALVDSYAGPEINPRFTGLSQDLGSLQIYLDIGRNDYLISPLLALHEDMGAQQVDHTWVLNEGTHEDAYWQTHLPEYLLWYAGLWPSQATLYPPCRK